MYSWLVFAKNDQFGKTVKNSYKCFTTLQKWDYCEFLQKMADLAKIAINSYYIRRYDNTVKMWIFLNNFVLKKIEFLAVEVLKNWFEIQTFSINWQDCNIITVEK